MATVVLRGVTKTYPGRGPGGGVPAIRGIDLDVADGELVVLVGPSGCGKSTLLRMVAGLETVTSGEVLIGGRTVNALEPAERDIAMVFQNYALYPHMSVRQNMAYGLRNRRTPPAEIATRVAAAAEMLELTALLDRRPRQLSGGQRQRVAMGRAIVREPAAFLFDEPLSNLDAKLRVQMRVEIKRLQRRLRTTSLYVTHDQVEAMTLADRLVVMNAGVADQIGVPLELYERPATAFVAGFIGSPAMNLLAATVAPDGRSAMLGGEGNVSVLLPRPLPAGQEIIAGIRPEHLEPGHADGAAGRLTLQVELIEALGADSLAYGISGVGAEPIVVRLAGGSATRVGEALPVAIPPAHLHLFDRTSGRRL